MNVDEKKSGRILITGGTSGLGLELVKSFLRSGYEVYATGRNQKDVLHLNDNFHFIKVDFSDLKEIAAVFYDFKKSCLSFDIIINNAGILSPPFFTLTGNSIEYTFQVNFLSHLLIDDFIIRNINGSSDLTIVSITSPVYKYIKPEFKIPEAGIYRSYKAYAESKLYLLMMGEYLLRKFPVRNLRFIGYDPGTFSSGIYRMQEKWFQTLYHFAAPFMRRPETVASGLIKILGGEKINNGAIYNHRGSFRYSDSNYFERNNEFMLECERIIEPFLIS